MNNMEYTDKEHCLEIWGDWLDFTRPGTESRTSDATMSLHHAARAVI